MTDSPLQTLGHRLRALFDTTKSERSAVEDRWLRDLRQYKGLYDPEELARMQHNRSRAFTRMTRVKVKSVDARLMDLMFPAGSEDNWTIEPTPNPDVQVPAITRFQMEQQLQRPLTAVENRALAVETAKEAGANMSREIRDQLAEVGYRKIMKEVIHSGDLYGTGVLKGPLVSKTVKKTWVMGLSGEWNLTNAPLLMPYIEFVPVWHLYPDTSATDFASARFVFQRNIMPRHAVMDLADRPDFLGDVVRSYVREHKDGDILPLSWENELRRMGLNYAAQANDKRFEVLEYWGVVSAEDMGELGLMPDPSMVDEELWGTVWLLGNKVIKAELQPIEGVKVPFYAYYYDKDETSIFGEGVSAIMRDEQKGLNASLRAVMDNAAICAGPQFEVNVDLLSQDDDPRDAHPFRVWLRSGVGAEANYPALRVQQLPSYTNEFLQIFKLFEENIHESTIPSYMHGEGVSKGSVGRTVGGLSMLMGAAQVTLKDQLSSIDDVVRDFIGGMYHWNMQFNPKPEIKGDFSVVVKGTSSLVAREVRAQNLDQFAQSTLNQVDQPFVNRYELLKQRVRVLELGDSILNDKDEQMRAQVMDPAIDVGLYNDQTAAAPVPATANTEPGVSAGVGAISGQPPGGIEGQAGIS